MDFVIFYYTEFTGTLCELRHLSFPKKEIFDK